MKGSRRLYGKQTIPIFVIITFFFRLVALERVICISTAIVSFSFYIVLFSIVNKHMFVLF